MRAADESRCHKRSILTLVNRPHGRKGLPVTAKIFASECAMCMAKAYCRVLPDSIRSVECYGGGGCAACALRHLEICQGSGVHARMHARTHARTAVRCAYLRDAVSVRA